MSKRIMIHKSPDGKLSKVVVDKDKQGSLTKEDACMGIVYDCDHFKNKACSKLNDKPENLIHHLTDRGKFGCPEYRWWYAGPTEEGIKNRQAGTERDGEAPFEIQEGMSLIIKGVGKPKTNLRVVKTNKKVYNSVPEVSTHEHEWDKPVKAKGLCHSCHFGGWYKLQKACQHPAHPGILEQIEEACPNFRDMFDKYGDTISKVPIEQFT